MAAFRAVEIRVRALAGFGDEIYGVDLMRKAFGPNGPLSDPQVLRPSGAQSGSYSPEPTGLSETLRATAPSISATSRWPLRSSCLLISCYACSIGSSSAAGNHKRRRGGRLRVPSCKPRVEERPYFGETRDSHGDRRRPVDCSRAMDHRREGDMAERFGDLNGDAVDGGLEGISRRDVVRGVVGRKVHHNQAAAPV